MGWLKTILKVVVGAACVVAAAAHGMMTEPSARNVVHNSNYCPHCLAAGGPGVTYAGGRVWPNALHGVCGDPHTGPLDHEAGGKFATKAISAKYVKGQRITIRIKITAPHGGRFSFGVCPVPDGASDADERRVVTQKCFDANRLKNAEDGSEFWWFGKKPTGEYSMEFTLPPAISCKRCVLQWHYETGNSCTIPGTPPQHVMSAGMLPCDKTPVMEEFWNCADVSIADSGDPAAAPAAPSSKKKVTKRAANQKKKTKEGFAPFGAEEAGGLMSQLASAVLILAIAILLPPVAGISAGVGALVWYVVYRQMRQMRPAGPRTFSLPAPDPRQTMRAWLHANSARVYEKACL